MASELGGASLPGAALSREWDGEPTIVAASGPSLTAEVIHAVRMARWGEQWRVLAVNDAARVMPWADAVYAADKGWWTYYNGLPDFSGQRWCCLQRSYDGDEDGREFMHDFPAVRLVASSPGVDFSGDAARIHYGHPENSGFQAINLALLLGASWIVLVGFDGRRVEGKAHFFGDHPPGLNRQLNPDTAFAHIAQSFDAVTDADRIINATPDSAITRFQRMPLHEALHQHDCMHRHGAESHAAAD